MFYVSVLINNVKFNYPTMNTSRTRYYCYLLQSENQPRRSYIGFSTNPLRRLRQHNGEIKSGANKTSKSRPWKLILIVGCFHNHKVGLMFEWQWQHPKLSRILKNCNDGHNKSVKGCITTLSNLLSHNLWSQCNLNIYIFDQFSYDNLKKLLNNQSSNNTQISIYLPQIIRLNTDEFQTILNYHETTQLSSTCTSSSTTNIERISNTNDINTCGICKLNITDGSFKYWSCSRCTLKCHIICLSQQHFNRSNTFISSMMNNDSNVNAISKPINDVVSDNNNSIATPPLFSSNVTLDHTSNHNQRISEVLTTNHKYSDNANHLTGGMNVNTTQYNHNHTHDKLIPIQITCIQCNTVYKWSDVIHEINQQYDKRKDKIYVTSSTNTMNDNVDNHDGDNDNDDDYNSDDDDHENNDEDSEDNNGIIKKEE